MVDHLKEAKFFAHAADELGNSLSETGRCNALLAIARVLISIRERMEQDANLALVSQVDQDLMG